MTGLLATTGAATGIGGEPLPLWTIVAGVLIVAVPYGLALIVAARRGELGTGQHEIRTEPGPRSTRTSVQASLSWLAENRKPRSVLVRGPGNRSAYLKRSGDVVTLSGFDGESPLVARDVGLELSDAVARRRLGADLDQRIGAGAAPVVATFEQVVG